MSRFKEKKPHKVIADAFEYKYIIAGRPKAGKTSLVHGIVKEKYDGDLSKLLLVAFERGYKALDGIYAEDIDEWEDFQELVEDLVNEKDEVPFKILAFDTVDIMGKLASNYVLKKQGFKDKKRYTAMADLAYGKGYDLLEGEMGDQIAKLERAGYTLIFITHDKDRKFTSREGHEYDKTTLSLGGRVRDLVLNMVDFIVFVEIGKELVKGKAVDKRYIYFRGDSGLEAGSRFKHVPNKIDYDFRGFLDTVEDAILAEYGGDQKAVDTAKKEQADKKEKETKEYLKNEAKSDSESESDDSTSGLMDKVDELLDSMDKQKKIQLVKFTNREFGVKDFHKLEDVDSLKQVHEYATELLKN